jgi:hypothetical protein
MVLFFLFVKGVDNEGIVVILWEIRIIIEEQPSVP